MRFSRFRKSLAMLLLLMFITTPVAQATDRVRIEYDIHTSSAHAGHAIEVSIWETDAIGRRLSSAPSAKHVYEITENTFTWPGEAFVVRDRNRRYELTVYAGEFIDTYYVRLHNGQVTYAPRNNPSDWQSSPPRFNIYDIGTGQRPSETDDVESYWGQVAPDDTVTARLFAKLVESLVFNLWQFLGLNDPVVLFFGVDPTTIYDDVGPLYLTRRHITEEHVQRSLYVDPEAPDTFLYTFGSSEENMMGRIYGVFAEFLRVPYVIAVAAIGLAMVVGSFYARDRSHLKMTVGGILLFPALLRFFPALLEPLFWLNYTIVRAVGSVAQEVTTPTGQLVDPLSRPFVTILIGSGTNIGALGVLIGTTILLFLLALLNYQYFIRRMMLAVLIVMFPIVAFLQIFPGNRQTLNMWWSEFTSNLFLQSAHAIVYLIFISYVYKTQLPFIPVLAMMGTLATVTVFVRNLMGCRPGSGMLGMFGNVLGFGALLGAGRVAGSIVSRAGTSFPAYTDPREDKDLSIGSAVAGVAQNIGGDNELKLTESTTSTYNSEPLAFGGFGDGPTPQTVVQEENMDILGEATNTVEESGSSPLVQQQPGSETLVDRISSSEGYGPPVVTDAEETRDSLTGKAYGAEPRVPRIEGELIKGAAKWGTFGTMSLGMLVGTAAFGPGGAGIGALAGAKGASFVVGGADYGYGITRNYLAREKFLNDIKKNTGIKNDTEAAIYAATGVRATKEEILADPVMTQQYWNIVDVLGLSKERADLDQFLGDKKFQDLKTIRADAEKAREQYIAENPEASIQEINQEILNHVIRREPQPKDESFNEG